MKISTLTVDRIEQDLLSDFYHHQLITKQWIRKNNKWEITDTSILREWSDEKRKWIPQYWSQQIERGGTVIAAFEADKLIGFCSLDGRLLGETAKYANLTMLFVDDRWKRKGVGKKLFLEICNHAEKMKADKLFISAIPSVDTLNFYYHMGCKDSNEIISEYVDTEQDRYLEFTLGTSK